MKLTGILTLILKLDQDQKTLGYLYCSVVAGEGISWPQRLVTLILSSLLLNGSVLDRSHKSRCCSSSAELIPYLKILQKWSTNSCLISALPRAVFLEKYYSVILVKKQYQHRWPTASVSLPYFLPVLYLTLYTFNISKTQFQRHINVNALENSPYSEQHHNLQTTSHTSKLKNISKSKAIHLTPTGIHLFQLMFSIFENKYSTATFPYIIWILL